MELEYQDAKNIGNNFYTSLPEELKKKYKPKDVRSVLLRYYSVVKEDLFKNFDGYLIEGLGLIVIIGTRMSARPKKFFTEKEGKGRTKKYDLYMKANTLYDYYVFSLRFFKFFTEDRPSNAKYNYIFLGDKKINKRIAIEQANDTLLDAIKKDIRMGNPFMKYTQISYSEGTSRRRILFTFEESTKLSTDE